ncbi:MFS family permease [Saccharothrix coeruleofusca]|uniref:MFS transporter n=1 Tax=Saccharothrix coeruleofusca TaxID=33919 RepID=UPI001AE4A975|nr:MFS transporter [Saccharothrix coeruleofusca]MBP2336558.1 MFS family permease [Saccharothrix coeruleofusca]
MVVVLERAAGWQRRLMWGRGVSALGDGLWFTTWALYFTRVAGFPPVVVGVGMTVAGACGLLAAVPLGALADRLDPRRVLVAITGVRAVAMACYLLVDSTWAFLVVTVAFVALANGGNAARTALVSALVSDDDERVAVLARQRVAQHVGYAAGAGLGALVLSVDQPGVYHLSIAGNAVSFLVLAAVTVSLPSPGVAVRRPSARTALRDLPYLAVTAVTAVLSLCWAMLSTGLPLWIAATGLPLSLSGAVVVLSSVGIAALQVAATRLATSTTRAARTAVGAGVALAASCLLLAVTGSTGAGVGVGIVLIAALLHLAGELGYVAAGWRLSISLMRPHAHGAYQGATEAATATAQMLAPSFFTMGLAGFGAGGWVLAAAVFLAAGAAVPALTRWAVRTR